MEFFNIGPGELLLVLVVALIVFGPAKLPEMGRTIGKGLREFRRATSEVTQEFTSSLDLQAEAPPPSAHQRYQTCPNCGTSNPQNNGFCGHCGVNMVAARAAATHKNCDKCGTLNEAGNAFCGQCGATLGVKNELATGLAPEADVATAQGEPALPNGTSEQREVTTTSRDEPPNADQLSPA